MTLTPQRARRRALAWLVATFAAWLARLILGATGHVELGTLILGGAGPLCLAAATWYGGWRRGHSAATKDVEA